MQYAGDDNFKGEESKEKPAEGEVSSHLIASIEWSKPLFFSRCPTENVIFSAALRANLGQVDAKLLRSLLAEVASFY